MLGKEDTAAPIIRAIVDLAKALHVRVTIEGVETVAQREIVLAMGCEELQGYLFAPALRETEMIALLNRSRRPSLMPAATRRA